MKLLRKIIELSYCRITTKFFVSKSLIYEVYDYE